MKNRLLIRFALWILSKVDKQKLCFKNSFDTYVNGLKEISEDEEIQKFLDDYARGSED